MEVKYGLTVVEVNAIETSFLNLCHIRCYAFCHFQAMDLNESLDHLFPTLWCSHVTNQIQHDPSSEQKWQTSSLQCLFLWRRPTVNAHHKLSTIIFKRLTIYLIVILVIIDGCSGILAIFLFTSISSLTNLLFASLSNFLSTSIGFASLQRGVVVGFRVSVE